MNCIWSIRRPYNFVLKFTQFNVEYHKHCIYDYIQVDNGGRICGSNLPPDVLGNETIQIRFRSDGSIPASGFKIEVSELNNKGNTYSQNTDINVLIWVL